MFDTFPCECLDPTRIHQIFVYVAVDNSGTEGIVPMLLGDTIMPLLGADVERIAALRPYAVIAAKARRRPVRLLRFHLDREIEVIDP